MTLSDLLLVVVAGLLVAIYRRLGLIYDFMTRDHRWNEAVAENDLVFEEVERMRSEVEWRDVLAEKVQEEAVRRLRSRGLIK